MFHSLAPNQRLSVLWLLFRLTLLTSVTLLSAAQDGPITAVCSAAVNPALRLTDAKQLQRYIFIDAQYFARFFKS